jgi:uncharacterized membrane protein (UPF0182 family)
MMRPRGNGNGNQHDTNADRVREFRSRTAGSRPGAPPQPPQVNVGGAVGCFSVIIIGLLLLTSATTLLNTWVDWQWFGSLGYQSVFSTVLTLRGEVLIGAALLAGVFAWVNWFLAGRVSVPARLYLGQQTLVPPGLVRGAALLGSILLAIAMGLVASDEWSTILRFTQQVPFGQTDPIFGQDIGFYVFSLPFYEFLRGWAIALIIVTAIGVGAIYATRPGLFVTQEQRVNLDPRVMAHLTVLGALFLILIGVGYLFSGYNLLFSAHDALYGVSYTDEHARLLGYRILLVVALGAAALLLVNLVLRRPLLLVAAFGVWLLALVVVGGLYPAYVQNFQVRPSELAFEQPYIQNHIRGTRAAYGLDNFTERPFDAVESPPEADLAANQATVNNIRLWDYRPLLDVFTQLQAIRSYYVFNNVDIDRYQIGGAERQVMVAAREMDITRLPEQASTWLNQHLVYTHGYGAVVVPVNEIGGAGLPNLLLKDLPPQAADPSLTLTQPRIYYGEAEDNYVFVNTGQPEFDYPLSNEAPLTDTTATESGNATTVYTGTGGIKLGGLLSKLLFSAYLGDGNVLLSEYINDDTRVLIHRDFHDAVQQVAPFLRYDRDPYIVIADGKLYWIQDAFTTTDHYPYSLPYGGDYNYIRNSVKVVIDAYNGSINFYVFDPTDPIIQTYRRIFPTLFRDKAELPASLQAHVRYPESMFNVQASMYATFHMTNVTTFYNQEDKWNIPTDSGGSQSLPMEAYYNIMKVPGEDREEFLLMLPFTPNTRQNMIAWMAAKGDDPDYGRVDVIRFPPTKTIYGPEQIGQLINRDPQISSDLALWNRQGSTVVRGNLLVIPVARSVMYVEPVFIQASSGGGLPGLQRVIAVIGNGVGYDSNLPKAIVSAFIKGAGGTTEPPPPPTPGAGTPTVPTPGLPGTPILGTPIIGTPGACSGDAATLSQSAFDHYQRSQDALKRGDWATYGLEQAALQSDLLCLQQITR